MYNEIFPPIIEKGLLIELNDRSCFQLLELYEETKGDTKKNVKPKTYKASRTLHSTMFVKTCIERIEIFNPTCRMAGYKNLLTCCF